MSYRLVVVGATSAGKSGLTERYVLGTFVSEYGPTIDEIYSKRVDINAQACALNIVDVSGLAEYNALAEEHMKSGDVRNSPFILLLSNNHLFSHLIQRLGFVLVYSVTSRATFTHAVKVRASIIRVKNIPDIPIVLVGQKTDLESERVIPADEGQRLATEWACGFLETSAKENKNVEEVFIEIIQRIDDWKIKHPPLGESTNNNNNNNNNKRGRSASKSWRRSSQMKHGAEGEKEKEGGKESKGTACVLL